LWQVSHLQAKALLNAVRVPPGLALTVAARQTSRR
jgi:hypothetical protein